jgi:prepilin-type N-terminal cleavage/methylation domain-containing protein
LEHSNSKLHLLKNQAGFTLIEVLIAITILSFITFATYQMIDSNTTAKDRVVREDKMTVQGLTAIGRLDADISQIVNPLFSYGKMVVTTSNVEAVYSDNNNTINGSFDGKTQNGALIPQFKSEDKSSIVFLTQANRRKLADSKESRYAWIKYSLRRSEEDIDNEDETKTNGNLFELVRQSIATDIYNSNLDWSKPKSQVVLERVKELEFSFWDERSKKFTSSLQELNENKNLIRQIKVTITWLNEDDNEQKIEKIFRVLAPYFNTKLDQVKLGTNPGTPGIPGIDPNASGQQPPAQEDN